MKKSARLIVFVALCSFLVLSVPGCYREVISAKGIGTDEKYPRRARSSETKIDKAIDDLFEEKN